MSRSILSHARWLALAFPLYGVLSSVQIGCGSTTTNQISSTAYGAYGRGPHGHYGYYGYYGCTDGYGYLVDVYGYETPECDDATSPYYGP